MEENTNVNNERGEREGGKELQDNLRCLKSVQSSRVYADAVSE